MSGNGGYFAHEYHKWRTDPCAETGAVLEIHFPCAAGDLPCECPYPHDYFIDDWAYVADSTSIPPVDAIKSAIMAYGPITAGIDATGLRNCSSGIFSDCDNTELNHAIVLIGWDDNQGTNGIWIMRNSRGLGWGENGYGRIPHACNQLGFAACFIEYRQSLEVLLPDGIPEALPPDQTADITVRIVEISDQYLVGTGLLHYRFDDGAFQTLALEPIGGDLYRATLPAAGCDDAPQFYICAEGVNVGVVTNPADAPTTITKA